MSRHFTLAFVTILLVLPSSAPADVGHGSDLFGLARVQSGMRTRRVSSYDRTGGNNDRFERIQDGQTRELFNVRGAGIINHIWITIAPPPEQLSRNDIILRMYWDGNEFPSVESPIGPFFGQGWTLFALDTKGRVPHEYNAQGVLSGIRSRQRAGLPAH